jgi:hypothetical protein
MTSEKKADMGPSLRWSDGFGLDFIPAAKLEPVLLAATAERHDQADRPAAPGAARSQAGQEQELVGLRPVQGRRTQHHHLAPKLLLFGRSKWLPGPDSNRRPFD